MEWAAFEVSIDAGVKLSIRLRFQPQESTGSYAFARSAIVDFSESDLLQEEVVVKSANFATETLKIVGDSFKLVDNVPIDELEVGPDGEPYNV
jgi:hypothetical protein